MGSVVNSLSGWSRRGLGGLRSGSGGGAAVSLEGEVGDVPSSDSGAVQQSCLRKGSGVWESRAV